MVEILKKYMKDRGLKQEVLEALPYAVVGGAWEGSFDMFMFGDNYFTALNHIVPTGVQLKILFLKVWSQYAVGSRYSIFQTNPALVGVTGTVEAFPVVGSVPSGARDYPFLEAAGSETLRGSLIDPVHVLEGSVDFRILAQAPGAAAQPAVPAATGDRWGIVWWGVQAVPDQEGS